MLGQNLAEETYLSSEQARLTVTSMQPLQQQWQQLGEVAHTGKPQSLQLAGSNKVGRSSETQTQGMLACVWQG